MIQIKRKKGRIKTAKILSLLIFSIVLMTTLFFYRTYGEILTTRGDIPIQEVLGIEKPGILLFSFLLLHIVFFSLASLQRQLCKRDRTKHLELTPPINPSKLHPPKLRIPSPTHKQEV